jgi:hypothetical protein
VQGSELVGAEAGITQVVAVLGDPVAVDCRQGAGNVLHLERHAHRPQVILVTLEGSAEGIGLGCVHPQPVADLEGRQRARRLEQQRRQVEQPFELCC